MPTDLELLARVKRKEEAALAELYRRHGARIYGLALRMLGSREEAQEVLQDTFVNLYDKADHYRGFRDPPERRAAVGTYLYAIARNEALMRLRARRARPCTEGGRDPDRLPAALLAPQRGDPIDVIMIEDALRSLAPEDRRLVQQAFFLGHSHSELAELTGMPLGTVKTRLRRALLQLRSELEKHGTS